MLLNRQLSILQFGALILTAQPIVMLLTFESHQRQLVDISFPAYLEVLTLQSHQRKLVDVSFSAYLGVINFRIPPAAAGGCFIPAYRSAFNHALTRAVETFPVDPT